MVWLNSRIQSELELQATARQASKASKQPENSCGASEAGWVPERFPEAAYSRSYANSG